MTSFGAPRPTLSHPPPTTAAARRWLGRCRVSSGRLFGGGRAPRVAPTMQQEGEGRAEIYTYESPSLVYSAGWSVSAFSPGGRLPCLPQKTHAAALLPASLLPAH